MSLSAKIRKFREILKFDNSLQILINRALFPGTSSAIYRFKGVTALVDHSKGDQDGVKSCLVPGLYDVFLDLIAPTLKGPLRILDFGANTGGFPLVLRSRGWEVGEGIAVELNPITCTRLSLNLAQNGLHEPIRIVNGAVCGHSREIRVRISQGSVSDSIVFAAEGEPATTVRGWTIDELVAFHFQKSAEIDICKIDVEGAEYEIFEGQAYNSLRQCRWLIIEIHEVPDHQKEEIFKALEGLEFVQVQPASKAVEDNVYLFQARTSHV